MTRSDSADTGYTSVVDPITSRIRHGRYDVSMYDPKCLSKRNCTWTCREGGLGSKERHFGGPWHSEEGERSVSFRNLD